MVVFTCNNCGETLQKPRVAKHYQFHCRRGKFLTCVDCHKDFRGEEYVAHTKCITEAERYGGKDYVPKAGANKGEKKQQAWINVVQNLLNSNISLSPAERNFLNSISRYENIPRKKAKYLNFIRSAFANRINMSVMESVWTKMETAYQEAVASSAPEGNKTSNEEVQNSKSDQHQENNVAENENNENISRENGTQQNGNTELTETSNGTEQTNGAKKKKKSKKRQLSDSHDQEEQDPACKKSKSVSESNDSRNGEKSEQQDDAAESSPFVWKSVILEVVQAKGEISLKKLQKKVVSRYLAQSLNPVSEEKAISKFNKKLKKVSEIVVCDTKVRLA